MTDTALIVAAGRGIRMGPRGTLTPKGLLKINDTPLVARSVNLLQAKGVSRVRIVTGHLADQYEDIFGTMPGVELVHNPDFATTGSLRSMMTGLEDLSGPFVLLESDLIYETAALAPVLDGPSTILVSGVTGSGDEVYIWTRDEIIFDTMSKKIDAQPRAHFGELTGLSRFDAEDTERLKTAARAVLAEDAKADYEDSVIRLAQTRDIACTLIPDLAWSEVDTEEMLSRAIGTIWPRIQERDTLLAAAG